MWLDLDHGADRLLSQHRGVRRVLARRDRGHGEVVLEELLAAVLPGVVDLTEVAGRVQQREERRQLDLVLHAEGRSGLRKGDHLGAVVRRDQRVGGGDGDPRVRGVEDALDGALVGADQQLGLGDQREAEGQDGQHHQGEERDQVGAADRGAWVPARAGLRGSSVHSHHPQDRFLRSMTVCRTRRRRWRSTRLL